MFVEINFESDKPIYTQLVEQIIAGIAMKKLIHGERLPSVRNLAEDIGINMHTVNKAYQELRDRGFILIHRQRGVVVNSNNIPKADNEYINQINEQLHPLIAESICRGMTKKDMTTIINQIYDYYLEKGGNE